MNCGRIQCLGHCYKVEAPNKQTKTKWHQLYLHIVDKTFRTSTGEVPLQWEIVDVILIVSKNISQRTIKALSGSLPFLGF